MIRVDSGFGVTFVTIDPQILPQAPIHPANIAITTLAGATVPADPLARPVPLACTTDTGGI